MVEVSVNVQVPFVTVIDLWQHRIYRPVIIETLPDEALLIVFDFYVDNIHLEGWITLTHVCRRWRYIIFSSPLRLNLRLCCKGSRPVREMLDIWPPFPIEIYEDCCSEEGVDNIIAALEHHDHVYRIYISSMSSSLLERITGEMLVPFWELTVLALHSNELNLVLPETLLGGSAPSLRSCYLANLPFPALRKLLLSASHLVTLSLEEIPYSGYIPPEVMVTCLSAATCLKSLVLGF